ncbi:MAG: DUF1080 domain-containing protein [Planctomycetes bacterium]|nr:DUF1080 domain-containing protein [Planctomycetota bacterium]
MFTRYAVAVLAFLIVPASAVAQNVQTDREAGVLVRLYDIGAGMHWLPEIARGELPNAAKVLPTVDLLTHRGDFEPLKDLFITEVVGFLNIEQPGEYAFRLISDDGSKLWIAGRLVVDHDGWHGATPKDGTTQLGVGKQALRVLHFDNGGDEVLELMWRFAEPGVESEFQPIPAELLSHAAGAATKTAPGRKRIVPPLRRGRPGDGTPVAGMHAGFDQTVLASAMYGMQAPAECTELEVRTSVPSNDERSIIFLPECGSSARVSHARLADPNHVLGTRGLSAADMAGDVCLIPLVVGADGGHELYRVVPEKTGKTYQGCVMRFAAGLPGPITRVDGAIPQAFVVNLLVDRADEFPNGRAMCFVRPNDRSVFEILAVRALTNGFEIEFTKPLDPRCGWEADSYYIEQWPFRLSSDEATERRSDGGQEAEPEAQARVSATTGQRAAERETLAGASGSDGIAADGASPPTRDGVRYPVKSASVSADRKRVFLEIENLKTSDVVYIRLLPPCVSEDGELPWSTEAWYTLNAIPKSCPGKVLAPPQPEPQNFLTDEERAAGWELLFDGKTTTGWIGYGSDRVPDSWRVIDGCIVLTGSGGDIVTTEQFDNFELKLDWRICAGGNSGIFYHVGDGDDYVWRTGPEMQVLDNAEHADGRNPLTSAGSAYALYAPPRDPTRPVGFFNEARMLVNGDHVEFWLNGVKTAEYEQYSDEWEKRVAASKFAQMPKYGRLKTGRIALQDHGDRVWFRNIKIRRTH